MDNKTKAIISLACGIGSLLAWLLPFIGLPVSIVGIITGSKTIKTEHKNMAIAGLILSILGLIATVINMVLGAIAAVSMLPYL